jgi:hypothetical protein
MRGCVLPTHLTLSRLRKVASVASPLESPEEFRGVSSSVVQTVSTTWTNKGRCSTDKGVVYTEQHLLRCKMSTSCI